MTRIVLVTGANRGIGRELARQLALRGDAVVLTARELAKAERAAPPSQASSRCWPDGWMSPTRPASSGSPPTSPAATAGWTLWSTTPPSTKAAS
jgi:NAD(P)-dependent dehydrogenase (short-subunit alcohol dehydrogenase family)